MGLLTHEESFPGLDRRWPIASEHVGEFYLAFEFRLDRETKSMQNRSRYCLTRPIARPAVIIDGRPTKLVFYDHQRITKGLIDGTRPGLPRVTFEEPVDKPVELARNIARVWESLRSRNKHDPVLGLIREPS